MNIQVKFKEILKKYNIEDLSSCTDYTIEKHKLTGAVLVDFYDDYNLHHSRIEFYIDGRRFHNEEVFSNSKQWKLRVFK